jgi:hypothetical protein
VKTVVNPSRLAALEAARAEVTLGFAIRYLSDTDGVHIETDQGWQTWWSADEERAPYAGANDCNPD